MKSLQAIIPRIKKPQCKLDPLKKSKICQQLNTVNILKLFVAVNLYGVPTGFTIRGKQR